MRFYFLFVLFLMGCEGGAVGARKDDGATGAASEGRVEAQPIVGVDGISVSGSCQGKIALDLRVGNFRLPLVLSADTKGEVGSGADGAVLLDVAGILRAHCQIAKGVGSCGPGGI